MSSRAQSDSMLARATRVTTSAFARLQLKLGKTHFGPLWLLIVSGGAWVIATLYIPVVGASLSTSRAWMLSVAIMFLLAGSVLAHAWAHLLVARLLGCREPEEVPLTVAGDAAQVWPEAAKPWQEIAVASAGPAVNVLIAWTAWVLWNEQESTYVNVGAVLVGLFNLIIAAANIAPAYPFDGGRVAGALLRGIGGAKLRTARVALPAGYAVSAAVTAWGVFLVAEDERFSLATAAIAFAIAALILSSLLVHRARRAQLDDRTVISRSTLSYARLSLATVLSLAMLAPFIGLMPMNEGIKAPGAAVSTEDMVEVPEDLRHELSGTFMLTTVIPQTPIVAFEWLAAKVSPAIEIIPPEQVIPQGTTVQSVARQNFNALLTSENTAIVVALQLAGFDVPTRGEGAFVNSVLETSPAFNVLLPGDIIVELNGHPVTTSTDLIELVRAADPDEPVSMKVLRGGETTDLSIDLIPPDVPGNPPRIGITIETANLSYDLPFDASISPHKIAGGPSAGLMFTLTVYDLVTEEDLTCGKKIAGTGTIDYGGNVGPIGGVRQKVAAAEIAGAKYFLTPAANYEDASDAARKIEVVKVETAEQAIEFLRSLCAQQPE